MKNENPYQNSLLHNSKDILLNLNNSIVYLKETFDYSGNYPETNEKYKLAIFNDIDNRIEKLNFYISELKKLNQ